MGQAKEIRTGIAFFDASLISIELSENLRPNTFALVGIRSGIGIRRLIGDEWIGQVACRGALQLWMEIRRDLCGDGIALPIRHGFVVHQTKQIAERGEFAASKHGCLCSSSVSD